jgi:hypothetical protein
MPCRAAGSNDKKFVAHRLPGVKGISESDPAGLHSSRARVSSVDLPSRRRVHEIWMEQ